MTRCLPACFRALALIALIPVAACESATGPGDEARHLELSLLTAHGNPYFQVGPIPGQPDTLTALPGYISAGAWPAVFERPPRLQRSRADIMVRTSDGDVETLTLRFNEPGYAPCPRTSCVLDIGIRDLQHVYELMPLLEKISARYERVVIGEASWARVRLFDDNAFEAVLRARFWSGVRYARIPPNKPVVLQSLSVAPPPLMGHLPVAFGEPAAGDGILQVSEGSIVMMEYQQPDGSVLVAEL